MTTMAMNLYNRAITQYVDYDYDSMGFFGDKVIGLCADGLHELERDDVHDGPPIDAWLKSPYTDFGVANQKHIRSFLVGGEADDQIELTVETNEDSASQRTWSATFAKADLKLSGAKAYGTRFQKARYFQFEVANINGSRFGIEKIEALVVFMHTKPRGV